MKLQTLRIPFTAFILATEDTVSTQIDFMVSSIKKKCS